MTHDIQGRSQKGDAAAHLGRSESDTGLRKANAPSAAATEEPRPQTPLRVAACCGEPADSVVLKSDGTGEAASEIRALRARILARSGDDNPQVIAVTSASRGEGKSTISINLAIALSEVATGRVVVVDGDFLAPNVHLLANVQAKTGFADILREDGRLAGHVYETKVPSCDVIAGLSRNGMDGTEAMLALKCEKIMAELRRYYTYIVVDTPPLFASSHARTFAKYADGVILVSRLEKTPREVTKRAAEELTASGATIIGGILTHRKHHIPNLIYRFLGSTPSYYYNYYRKQNGKNGKKKG